MVDEEYYEEAVMSDSEADDEEGDEELVEADEMTAEEAGFLRGYKEADSVASRNDEAEEEELE